MGNGSPQRDNRQAHRGPRGAHWIFGFGGNPCKTLPWEGLGGNWYTQRVPGYHTNHSPRKKSWETSWGTNPSTKLCFSGPLFGPKKGPGPSKTQIWGWGLQKWGLGSKISKLGNQKPCRIHWSMPQMEPYVASYGLKLGGSPPGAPGGPWASRGALFHRQRMHAASTLHSTPASCVSLVSLWEAQTTHPRHTP